MTSGAASEDKKSSDTDDAPFAQQQNQSRHFAVVGKGMRQNNALLTPILNADVVRWYPWSSIMQRVNSAKNHPDAFIGWGQKKSYQRANKAARRQNIDAISVEDGFLRSLDSGILSRHGLSMVVDDIGIYFDLTQPSRLEQLIITRIQNQLPAENDKAKRLIERICTAQLSKYNAVIDCPLLDQLAANDSDHPNDDTQVGHVLLIDQVQGDASIKGAGANKRQFKKMLRAAIKNHPNAYIWIKAHPASDNGYLTALTLPKNVRVIKQAVNPIALLKQVDQVYTVSSHMGFEALMLGKTVHCFGVNWYSGWGLTDDTGAPKRLLKSVKKRRQGADAALETLFYSAYIEYSRYADPASGQACNIDTAIAWLTTNREWQQKLVGDLTIFEFSRWKLPFVKAFVDFPRTKLFIKPKPRLKNLLHPDHFRVDYDKPLLVWGLAKRQQVRDKLAGQSNKQSNKRSNAVPPIYCMEDGFIRSNGLGATLLAPLSVVIDQRGIYYDATQPSDLEVMLRECPALTPEQLARVQQLQHRLLTQRVSKYNVGKSRDDSAPWLQEVQTTSKPRLLIVGQVEDDLSVQYCGSLIKTNSALIERVRRDHPDAYLVYKPHPDVEAGLRAGKVTDKQLNQVDAVAHDMAMPDCLSLVDDVHTISSLTGFEALLRGLNVTCYGLPFYAGWGLTTDIDADLAPKSEFIQRRQRQTPLSLPQLLHCTLINYPLYRLPDGYGLAQVEQVIDCLYPSTTTDNSQTDKKNPHSSGINIKRRAATRFMQQRHRLFERLSKR